MVAGPLAVIKQWTLPYQIPYDPLSPFVCKTEVFFFLVINRAMYTLVRFLATVRAMAAHCMFPFALRPGLTQESESVPRRLQRK
jgi:hypothetical protein